MGCCGDREKARPMTEEQKWDYITLSDFKSTSCLTPISYGWLWILVIVSVAVYAADAFTCISLLAFNKWTSQVKPKVDFNIAKWIFAICIIVSYVFLIYRWIKAVRIIRKGGVVESYLDPLTAVFQSTRDKLGWRRFLVFAELTKSSKGKDYIAIFAYFQFKGALLIVIAQGPRIAINALTLWAVMEARLIPKGENAAPKDRSPVAQFFVNIEAMAETGNKMETVIYFSMLFSLVIWAIAAISLLLSMMFYLFFLVWMIPKSDGRRLSRYCRRKIEARLERTVKKQIGKAVEKQDMKRRREEQEALKYGGTVGSSKRVPTLPKLAGQDDDNSSVFSLSRSDGGTLPPYQDLSRNGTVTSITKGGGMKPTLPSLSSMSQRPPPQRSETEISNFSYTSNAPLLDDASSMGMASPLPRMPPLDQNADYFNQAPNRNLPPLSTKTGWSDGRMSPGPRGISPLSRDPRNGAPPRTNTGFSQNRNIPISPLHNPNFAPYDNRAPARGPAYEMSPVDITPSDEYPRHQFPAVLRPGTPTRPNQNLPYPASNNSSFTSPPPSRSGAGTAPPGNPRAGVPAALQSAIQRREASNPLPGRGPPAGAMQMRSATAPIQQQQQQQQQWGPGNGGYGGAGGNPYGRGGGW